MIDYNYTTIDEAGPLDFGSDLHLRYKWFTPESLAHPAKLHLGLLHWILEKYTRPGDTIADPMCGIGSILYAATLQRAVIATEIEPRWLEIAHRNAAYIYHAGGLFVAPMSVSQHNAREAWGYQADHIIFSPPYGNEAGTTPNGRRMLPYKLHQGLVSYGERWQKFLDKPNAGTAGAVVFHYGSHPAQIGHFRGKRYWDAMTDIYAQAHHALRPGGYLILIVKDHISEGKRVLTADATVATCEDLGFSLYARHQRRVFPLSLWQRRRKEQGLPVVEEEDVLVFRKESEGVA